jgi:hypothetical protein
VKYPDLYTFSNELFLNRVLGVQCGIYVFSPGLRWSISEHEFVTLCRPETVLFSLEQKQLILSCWKYNQNFALHTRGKSYNALHQIEIQFQVPSDKLFKLPQEADDLEVFCSHADEFKRKNFWCQLKYDSDRNVISNSCKATMNAISVCWRKVRRKTLLWAKTIFR